MSGLFSRLAQQHLKHSTLGIKPVLSPVFPMERNEPDHGFSSEDTEPISAPQRVATSHSINDSHPARHFHSDRTVSSLLANQEVELTKPENSNSVRPALVPEIDTSTKVNIVHQGTEALPVKPLLTPDTPSAINTQLSATSEALPWAQIPAKNQRARSQQAKDTHIWAERNTLSKQEFNHHQVLPASIRNRKEQIYQTPSQLSDDTPQTTINISIGQIEIKATQAEKPEKKTPKRSNLARINSLEDYHQKRVRGER